ncbi:MAG: XRE family transcriptional regulator [Bacillota bacterium]|nr:XRE family transcriptional regulator [Bacillota bacterium]
MEVWSRNIRDLREAENISQSELARRLKFSSGSIISLYESGDRRPSLESFQKIADYFGVTVSYLIEGEQDVATTYNLAGVKRRTIPILGNIAGGEPIWADEDYTETLSVDDETVCDFALRVVGDSMAPYIQDGDIVFVRSQPSVENGQIAVVLIDDSATLKRFYKIKNGVQLVPSNPAYEPFVYLGKEAESIRVLGKAVRYTRNIE